MTKEDFAKRLDRRMVGDEIVDGEIDLLEENKLVVIFGYNDDTCEIMGAISDEMPCYEGGEIFVNEEGVYTADDYEDGKGMKKITAIWQKDGYSWIYETSIPHATFDIVEHEGKKYCRGIVFSLDDLK